MKVKEYTCSIKNNKFQFMNSKNVVILIDLRNKEEAYFINTLINSSNSRLITLTSRTNESVKTSWYQWYKWLAHLNMINIKRLVNISIDINVNSINSLENKEFSKLICKICVINKQNRTLSWKSHIKVIKADELVHMNLINDDKIFKIDEEFKYVAIIINKLIVKSSFHIYFLTRSSTWYQCRDSAQILNINVVTRLKYSISMSWLSLILISSRVRTRWLDSTY